MDIQLLTVILLFAVALLFIGRKIFGRIKHKATGDCTGCGKAEPGAIQNPKKQA